jgi:hypothetical protein
MKCSNNRLSFALAALMLVGCAASLDSDSASPTSGAPTSSGVPTSSGAPTPSGAPTSEGSAGRGVARGGQGGAQAGILTAGAWDDNRNFDLFEEFRAETYDQAKLPSSDEEHEAAFEKAMEPATPRKALDIALVIDTTGSMGDEIRYLQREFVSLSQRIRDQYADADQRWALIVYRDRGDEYVVRTFDFSGSAQTFSKQLEQQGAGGGGDYPEAPDQALAAIQQLSWRTDDSSARMAFWVADAPHHTERAGAMLDAVREARDLGVHVYPVASSGVDDLTELTMRSAAQLTGGRYLFLTDDSGVGLDHKEPRIPCYFVTHLDDVMLRMIAIELSGEYAPPSEAEIVRTAGDPRDGSCQLQSGDVAAAF